MPFKYILVLSFLVIAFYSQVLFPDTIVLNNGTILDGTILKESANAIVMKIGNSLVTTIKKTDIKSITHKKEASVPPSAITTKKQELTTATGDSQKDISESPEPDEKVLAVNPDIMIRIELIISGAGTKLQDELDDDVAELLKSGAELVPALLQSYSECQTDKEKELILEIFKKIDKKELIPILLYTLRKSINSSIKLISIDILSLEDDISLVGKMLDIDLPPEIERACDTVIIKIVEKNQNDKGYNVLKELMLASGERGRARLVQIVNQINSKESAQFSISLLDFMDESLLIPIMTGLGAVARYLSGNTHLKKLREIVYHEELSIRKEAIILLGKIKDIDSISLLVDFLEGREPLIVESAHWSLKNISGLQFPPEKNTWLNWLQNEQEGAMKNIEELRQKISSKDSSCVIDLLRRISQRTLFRDQVAGELVGLLAHEKEEVKVSTCLALANLGSKTPIPYLIELLINDSSKLREASYNALCSITSERFILDYSIWKNWFENERRKD
jgi:HEAT repeat protein